MVALPNLKAISEILLEIVRTQGANCNILTHFRSHAVTLKINPRSSKVDMSEILSKVTTFPNLNAIHQIRFDIYCGYKVDNAILSYVKSHCDLEIKPQSQKVDTSEILSMVTI